MLKEGNYVSLEELSTKDISTEEDIQNVRMWYAQSYSIVKFLIDEYGMEKFLRFSVLLTEEVPIDIAVQEVYPDTFTDSFDLISKWYAHIKLEGSFSDIIGNLYGLVLFSLIFLLPLLYLVFRLIGKWNYFTLAVSYLSALIVGFYSVLFFDFGFIIFPFIVWFMFYKTIENTLELEVEGVKPPGWLWFPVVIAALAPSYTLIEGLITYLFFLWSVSVFPIFKSQLVSFLLFVGPSIPMYFVYRSWGLGSMRSAFGNSLFNSNKYLILAFGFFCSYITFIFNFFQILGKA